MTGSPWYWTEARYDHWAVGLVACVGDNGRVHYSGVGKQIRTACEINQQPANVRLLEGPMVVDCRLCAAVARQDRDRIDHRHVQRVIQGHDRTNFIRREQQRKLHD